MVDLKAIRYQSMKNKIQIGQCYEKNDSVYEVTGKLSMFGVKYWVIENTLTKKSDLIEPKILLAWRRPFQNFG